MILKIGIVLLVLSLFIYSKLSAYEAKIFFKYSKAFTIIKSILKPILDGLNRFFKPFEVGSRIFIDTAQIILLILLLLILMQ